MHDSALDRRSLLAALLALPPLTAARAAHALSAAPDEPTDWQAIGEIARQFVAAESPASAFPFAPGRTGQGGTLVIGHYFPFYRPNIDNRPTGADYYDRHFLNPEGEGGKYRLQRGSLRERPLPVPVRSLNSFNQINFAIDVARAVRIGIDAFGIDILSINKNSVFSSTATMMLDAAAAVDRSFSIIPEIDFNGLDGVALETIVDLIQTFSRHPSAHRVDGGKLMVIAISPDRRPQQFWSRFFSLIRQKGIDMAFVPLYIDTAKSRDLIDQAWAISIWGDRTPNAAKSHLGYQRDYANMGVRRWIAPIATQDYRPKDGLISESHNSLSFRRQWDAALSTGTPFVHLITWNDYSESSQFAPSTFSQFVWYDLNAYYIARMKARRAPTLLRDALYYIHRRQIVSINDSTRGPRQLIAGSYPLQNEIEVIAMLTRPGTLTVELAGKTNRFDVGAGFQTIRVPAAPGRPRFGLEREGKMVLSEVGDWQIEAKPNRHDATYGGGSTTRRPAR
ncbi:endo-1,3-alpha-glucanase family glycosylhydrolase [Sphingomonas sp. CJ99]